MPCPATLFLANVDYISKGLTEIKHSGSIGQGGGEFYFMIDFDGPLQLLVFTGKQQTTIGRNAIQRTGGFFPNTKQRPFAWHRPVDVGFMFADTPIDTRQGDYSGT